MEKLVNHKNLKVIVSIKDELCKKLEKEHTGQLSVPKIVQLVKE